MRVAGIDIKGHPGIGDLAIDFRGADGRAPRHIVLAGGNGCGKSAVLESIFTALIPYNLLATLEHLHLNGRIRVFVEHDVMNAASDLGNPISPETHAELDGWRDFRGVAIEADVRRRENGLIYRAVIEPRTNTKIERHDAVETFLENSYGAFLSEAVTNFEAKAVQSTTAMDNPRRSASVPAEIVFPLRGGSNLSSIIPQLFVDLENADGLDMMRWHRDNPDGRAPAMLAGGRMQRFKEAFERLIPQKGFAGVKQVEGELRPVFTENGRETPLAKLSTGEKQIVFRGGFLLRQAQYMPGAIVMIDEPELSLHPNWQSGILGYYDKIVTETADKKSQIILATHSPFVVHGSPAAKHVILRRDNHTGVMNVDPSPTYPGVTAGDIAISAFDLGSFLFSRPGNTMVVAVEGKTDAQMIRLAWEKLRRDQPMPFNLMPSGSAGSLRQFLGHEPSSPGPLAEALADRGIDRVLGIFDFDKEGHGYWNKGRKPQSTSEENLNLSSCPWWRRQGTNIWSALLPVPAHRPTAASLDDGDAANSILTTELLFQDSDLAGRIDFVQVRHAPAGITRPVASNAQKVQIAEAAQKFPPGSYASFEPLLALIESILAKRL
ncbi:AAA family ATPase [Methylobacterium fujisawaense]